MLPKLYQKDGTTLIGNLTNCIECLVEEERNGLFEVTLQYPNNETISTSLVYDNIIICDSNDTLKNQKFRIYDTRRMMNNTIEVYARHISFDLAYDHIDSIDITNQSCEYALNTIFRNSQFSTGYIGHSDIINAQNYKISNCNALEAIAGKQGSIIDTYGTGAEILRDNTNIYVYNKRGNDNGVSIEYAKNLTGFELQENTDDLITRIIPFATYTPEGGTQTRVDGPTCNSQYITNYSHPFIAEIDFSDKFEDNEEPTASKLQTLAKQYFNNNKCDLPKQNWKIEFIPLSKCVGYENIEDSISLCDTVTIVDTRYNIDTKAKVIKTVYDVLRERYDSMELGEPRTTLGDIVNTGNEKGEQGPPGPQGPKGEDGNIGDFPDSLPSKPTLNAKLLGFASIQLDWTYENKPYYWYEVYANKEKDFTPNVFDIVHKGQTSSFLYQAKPGETWYFRVCGINSYDHRGQMSDQIEVVTTLVDNLENYFTTAAIGHAVVGSLTADYMEAGIIKGNWIDAKNLSVTDGNGKRTLDIDSFGNVNLDVTSLNISSKEVATKEYTREKFNNANSYTDSQITTTNNNINAQVETVYNSGITNIIPYSYFKYPETIKSTWTLNGVTWYEYNWKIGVQNNTSSEGYILSPAGMVTDRTVSLYVDMSVEKNCSSTVYLVGSTETFIQWDWVMTCFTYSNGEYGAKKVENIELPSNLKTLYVQISNNSNGNTKYNVVFPNKVNLVTGSKAKSIDLSSANQLAKLSIDTDGIKTEVSKKVGNTEIISKINQSPESISIDANKVNLNGYVTISNLTDGTTTISGENIKTGHIQGISLDACYLQGKTMCYIQDNGIFSCDGQTYIRDFYVPNTHEGWSAGSKGSFSVEPDAYFGGYIHCPKKVYIGSTGTAVRSKNTDLFMIDNISIQSEENYWMKMVTPDGVAYGVNIWVSDAQLKENIVSLDSIPMTLSLNDEEKNNNTSTLGLDTVNAIEHYSFDYKPTEKVNMGSVECGYISQQLQEINPRFVMSVPQDDGTEILQPVASEIIPYLSKAIKELSTKVNELENKITSMEQNNNKEGDNIAKYQ